MSIEAANFYSDHRVQASNARAWFIQADGDRQLVAVKVRTADYHWLLDNGYDPEEFDGGHKCLENIYLDVMETCPNCKDGEVLSRDVLGYNPWINKDGSCGRCNGASEIRTGSKLIGDRIAEGAEDRLYVPFRTVAFPCKMVDCDTCRGKGRHVNPSIDAGGITDFDQWDYDEQDAYMSGAYDVPCYAKCNNGKVPAVNVEAMCAEDLKVYTVWRAWQNEIEEEERAYAAERASEIRWGC